MDDPQEVHERWTNPEKWGVGIAAASAVVAVISVVVQLLGK